MEEKYISQIQSHAANCANKTKQKQISICQSATGLGFNPLSNKVVF